MGEDFRADEMRRMHLSADKDFLNLTVEDAYRLGMYDGGSDVCNAILKLIDGVPIKEIASQIDAELDEKEKGWH